MDSLWQDIRYGFRMLLKHPGFSAIAILTLALGIGINSSIFSIVNALLLRPIQFKDSDRLVSFWNHYPGLDIPQDWLSPGEFVDLKTQSDLFEDMTIANGGSFNLNDPDAPERVEGIRASSSLFTLLNIQPAQGRAFLAEEDEPGAPPAAVISSRLWQRRFGADPNLVGKTITLNGEATTVVGILPASVSFYKELLPTVAGIERVDIIRPLPLGPEDRNNHGSDNYNVMARLKPGVSLGEAQVQIDTIVSRLQQAYPKSYPPASGFAVSVVPMLEQVVGGIRPAILVLFVAVGLVLLIACANVANLLLARATAREKEFSIRTALGAGRLRLIRQLLVESLLLALAGSGAGLLLAMWSLEALRALGPRSIPRVDEIAIDGRVLLFTLIVSVLVGLIFGLVPAIKTSRVNINESLKEGSRHGGSGPRQHRLRGLLVASEIALSLVLLIGAGLLIRSFIKLQEVAPGFRAKNVFSMRLALAGPRYSGEHLEARRSFFTELWERLAKLPGVDSVGGVSILPLSPGMSWGSVWADGYSAQSGETELQADQRIATPDYFKAAGIPLIHGRFFDQRDSKDSPKVAIVDETFAQRFWPDEDPIGKRIKRGARDSERPWMTVVGVAGSVKQYALDTEPPRAAFYTPHLQEPSSTMYVVIHTASDPMALIGAVTSEVKALDAELPVYDVNTMDQRLADSLATRRFSMVLLGAFAVMALILAAVGTYGVMSYSITQRTHEIGIRMALGARAPDVLRLVVTQGIRVAGLGLATGIAGAFLLTRLMSSLLFGVGATDLLTFTVVPIVLAGVALAACLVPARRATKVDPVVALRYE